MLADEFARGELVADHRQPGIAIVQGAVQDPFVEARRRLEARLAAEHRPVTSLELGANEPGADNRRAPQEFQQRFRHAGSPYVFRAPAATGS
jgi:hypothetical protein